MWNELTSIMRTPKRRLYILVLVGALGVLFLHRLTNHRRSRDVQTPYLDETLSRDKNGANIETRDRNVAEENGEKVAKKVDDDDDSYEYNYAVAKLGFKRFKNQLSKDAKKDKRLNNIDVEEEEDNDDIDEYYGGFGNFMDAINIGDDVDNAKLAKMRFVDKIRDKLRPPSYNPQDAKQKTVKKLESVGAKQEMHKSNIAENSRPHKCEDIVTKGLFSEDTLVRNCITNGIIGRVPGVIETEAFTDNSVFEFSEAGRDRKNSFKKIFKNKVWGHSWDGAVNGLDASGRGATLSWTQELTAGLHNIINQLKTKLGKPKIRLLDVPCGDMKWMSRFLSTRDDIEYTGVDIVHDMIEQHRITYGKRNWKFLELDIVEEEVPIGYDLIICRTFFQHLYTSEVGKVLDKISNSGIPYLFATTFSLENFNSELEISDNNPGRFREINLELPPFSFEPPICLQRDGPLDDFGGREHFMGLWRMPLRQVVKCDKAKGFELTGTKQKVYSCMQWSPFIDWDS